VFEQGEVRKNGSIGKDRCQDYDVVDFDFAYLEQVDTYPQGELGDAFFEDSC